MTDIPTLSYTSTSEIPVLFHIPEGSPLGRSLRPHIGPLYREYPPSAPPRGHNSSLLKTQFEEYFFQAFLVGIEWSLSAR